jgi:hypothetical protein
MFSNMNVKLFIIDVITNNKVKARFSNQVSTSFKTLCFAEEISEINAINFLHIFVILLDSILHIKINSM